MSTKATMRYHFTTTRMAKIKKTDNNTVGEDVGMLEPSYTAGGNVKWCGHSGKQSSGSLRGYIYFMPQQCHS